MQLTGITGKQRAWIVEETENRNLIIDRNNTEQYTGMETKVKRDRQPMAHTDEVQF